MAVAERSLALLSEAAKLSDRKKRTRPVSACENCRSKKVKCVLKPDEPVCVNCSSSGKECLFRIDDLSPALRLERFAEYGPPSENARQIASTSKKTKSSSSDYARPRTSSSMAEEIGLEGIEGKEGEKKRRRLSSEGKSSNGKPKAVFRSFANPSKLGAPSRLSVSNKGTESFQVVHSNQPSSPRSQENLYSQKYDSQPFTQQQASPYNAVGSASSPPFRSYGPTVTPHAQQYAFPHPSTSYYAQSTEQAPHHSHHTSASIAAIPDQDSSTWQYPRAPPPPQNYFYAATTPNESSQYRTSHVQSNDREQRRLSITSSHSQTALPSFRSAFSSVDTRVHDKSLEKSRLPRDDRRSPNSSHHYRSVMSPKEIRDNNFNVANVDSNSSRPISASTPSSSWTDGYGSKSRHPTSSYLRQQSPGIHDHGISKPTMSSSSPSSSSSNPILLPSVLTPRSGLAALTGLDTSTSTSKHPIQSASPAIAPSRNDLAASNEGLGVEGDVQERRKGEGLLASQEEGSVAETTSSGSNRPPPSFKKIALPFFRWFGATANTPGIRRIKVGVYHEADMEEDHAEDDEEQELRLEEEHASPSSPTETRQDSNLKSPAALTSDGNTVGNGIDGPSTTTPREGTATMAKATPKNSHHGGESALSTSSRDLFESERPRYPRRDILAHLVNLFLKYFKASCFPWLDDAELVAGAESGELPAILANSICAVTARFSNHADLRRGSVKSAGEPFADMAKVLIVPMLSWPSVDVIEALVIISYSEFAAGADAGLWMYIGMALRMATDLGLQHEVTVKSMANKKQQDRARLLFWAIVSLDRITCFGTGRPVTVREDSFDCELPPLEDEPSLGGFVFGHIVRTLLKRGRIGELLNRKSDDLSLEERGRKLRTMWLDLAEYYDSLPPTLHFGVNTFRRLAAANQGAAFVYLHVLLQSTMSLLNRPSLLRRFDKDFSISAPTKLASIANHASGTIVSILRFAEDARLERNTLQDDKDENPEVNPYIDCNPYLDQLILPAGRAFLTEREAVRDALRRLGYAAQSRPVSRGGNSAATTTSSSFAPPLTSATDGPFNGLISSRQYAQTNLATCQMMLDRLAVWWSGASWPARALRQETAGASGNDVEPDGNDEDAQPAPIRDVEMVLKWAKARVKRIRAHQKTPIASRRASVDASNGANRMDGDDQSNKRLEGDAEYQNNNENTALSSLLEGQYIAGDSTGSGDSPFGLGFSGSFGTTSDIDIQALINAWANEENFIDSTQQQNQTDLTSQPQDWTTVSPNQFASLPAPPPPPPPQQRAATASATPLPVNQQQFSSLPIISTPTTNHHQWQTADMVGLDLNAMQLEEFFFKSDFDGGGSSGQPTLMVNHQGATTSEVAEADARAAAAAAVTTLLHPSNGGGGIGEASANLSTDGFEIGHGLDDLPSALFNAFTYHTGAAASRGK